MILEDVWCCVLISDFYPLLIVPLQLYYTPRSAIFPYVAFESGVFLLKKDKAKSIKAGIELQPSPELTLKPFPQSEPTSIPDHKPDVKTIVEKQTCTLCLAGAIPPEVWNRLGTKILPKLRSGMELQIGIDFRVTLKSDIAQNIKSELRQVLDDLGLAGKVIVEERTS